MTEAGARLREAKGEGMGIEPEGRAARAARAERLKTEAGARLREAKDGAGGGNRTHTTLRSPDFESGASASFTTPAIERKRL